jgi:hypothetical protein
MMTINLQSAPGPDGLPPRLVQSVFSTTLLLTFLARFLTRCFRAKWVPTQWRSSENFVLYKGVGDTTDVSSFRAISLTQILAKVFFLTQCVSSIYVLAAWCSFSLSVFMLNLFYLHFNLPFLRNSMFRSLHVENFPGL